MSTLEWHAERVQQVMLEHGIKSRYDLCFFIKLGRSTIYDSFDSSWAGKATGPVLWALAHHFRLPVGHFIHEPAERRKNS